MKLELFLMFALLLIVQSLHAASLSEVRKWLSTIQGTHRMSGDSGCENFSLMSYPLREIKDERYKFDSPNHYTEFVYSPFYQENHYIQLDKNILKYHRSWTTLASGFARFRRNFYFKKNDQGKLTEVRLSYSQKKRRWNPLPETYKRSIHCVVKP